MRKRILVVDDSVVVRSSIKAALEHAGLDSIEATDGQHALQILQGLGEADARPAMIITDLMMPNMDGITFIREIKKTRWKSLPILVMTTQAQENFKTEGKEAGAAGWLVKPFSEKQLISVIKKFVRFKPDGGDL